MGKKTRNVQKGGFAVVEIVQEVVKDGDPSPLPKYHVLADFREHDIVDTSAAFKWIRENAKDLDGKDVAVIQVKKTLAVKLESVQKVRLDIK